MHLVIDRTVHQVLDAQPRCLVLTQTRRDPQQLRIALDAAYVYLRSFAA